MPSITAPLLFLILFLVLRSMTQAQAIYACANLGPASFSQNWGASPSSNPCKPPVVVMKQVSAPKQVAPPVVVAEITGLPISSLSEPTVPGHRAVLRHGIAFAPEEAPLNVKRAIWATNTLLRKPYVWGGGHGSFFDYGYDCSGTVSFALHYAGLLGSPLDSRSLMSFGEPGPGRWMTVYARNGHTWMEIAGLRLDTTGFYGDEGPRWRADYRTPWGFTARHPVGL
jgi:hypothetical protein